MSDQATSEHSNMWKTIGIIALGILAIGAFVFLMAEDGQDGLEDDVTENIDQETQNKLYLSEQFYETVRPGLSTESQEDLDTLWTYIEEDPNVLNLDANQHPVYITEAYLAIKYEITESIGSGDKPTLDVEIGEEFIIEGELVETTEMGPFGPIYFVEDLESGATLYFAFDAETYEMIAEEEMTGEDVSIDIRITSVDGMNVTYYVISGPTLLVEETTDSE